MKRIATHKNPDADALVSAWLASRYLVDGHRAEVSFVGRECSINRLAAFDCVVDLSCVHDPERLIFDHKPPAFIDRNETCATRLIWEHLVSLERRSRILQLSSTSFTRAIATRRGALQRR